MSAVRHDLDLLIPTRKGILGRSGEEDQSWEGGGGDEEEEEEEESWEDAGTTIDNGLLRMRLHSLGLACLQIDGLLFRASKTFSRMQLQVENFTLGTPRKATSNFL
jgi:hypothetical protein